MLSGCSSDAKKYLLCNAAKEAITISLRWVYVQLKFFAQSLLVLANIIFFIGINVVVYVDGLFCIATNENNYARTPAPTLSNGQNTRQKRQL